MRVFVRRWGVVVALIFMAWQVAPAPPAGASPGVTGGIVQFGGTISPGLTAVPTNQTLTLGGTMTGVFVAGTNPVVGTVNCTFNGATIVPASLAAGVSSLSGSCSGAGVTITCSVTMVTVGGTWFMVMTCTICINSTCVTAVTWIPMLVAPTSAPGAPVTSFTAVGTFTAAGV
jgi:hypothetical protein